jgi:acyl-coenzyme A thioesterase PaaI-like protein
MRHVLGVLAIAVVASLVFAPVASAQGKVVRGKVVAVGTDTVTVNVAGSDMTFKVDKETDLIARGAGTAQRKAEQEGAPGVMLGKFVKPGEGVEVHYKEAAGVMMATEIRAGISVPAAAEAAAPTGSAKGAVTALAADSIGVKGETEWTFKVDSKTVVIGRGVGTLTKKFKEQGKAPMITDLVGVGDSVVVSFKEVAGAMQATEIRIVSKAAK